MLSWRSRVSEGFTLIELLIVIAIILILIAIALPNFLEAQIRAKVTRVEAELRTLHTAIFGYYNDRRVFPTYQGYAFRWVEQITTPIAYLATRVSDPFSPWANGGGEYQFLDAWKDAYGYHDYKNANEHGWGDEQTRKLGRRWEFWTYSLGPSFNYDKTGAVPGTSYERIARYSPTNGTDSIGLIFRVGP
jgi:general secretion pathway protein G